MTEISPWLKCCLRYLYLSEYLGRSAVHHDQQFPLSNFLTLVYRRPCLPVSSLPVESLMRFSSYSRGWLEGLREIHVGSLSQCHQRHHGLFDEFIARCVDGIYLRSFSQTSLINRSYRFLLESSVFLGRKTNVRLFLQRYWLRNDCLTVVSDR